MSILREDFQIELEMALEAYALAMTSPNSTDEDFTRLSEALFALDRGASLMPPRKPIPLPPMPEQVMGIGEALHATGRELAISESIGKISKTYIWAYPPGIPLIVPGQIITAEVAACVEALVAQGVSLKDSFGTEPGRITVIDK